MKSYDGTPMICSGSVIRMKGEGGFLGPREFSTQVDQTPVEVRDALVGATGLVEFTWQGVAVYIDAGEQVSTITPTFEKVTVEDGAADA
jgi:hypothetical protein